MTTDDTRPSADSRRPGVVVATTVLMALGAGALVVWGGLSLLAAGGVSDGSIVGPGVPGTLALNGGVLIVVATGIFVLAMLVWRRNRLARLLTTVVFLILIVLLAFGVFQGFTFNLVVIAALAGLIALLWTGAANRYFKTPSRTGVADSE